MSTANVHDVARAAKVSIGTVSRALNRHPSVSAENLERVMRAAQALNYMPRQRRASMAALNPLEGKNVLLLMLGMDRSLASLPVVASAIDGVEQAASSANAHLLVANVPAADRVPDVLLRKRIDGVILKGTLQGDWANRVAPELLARLRELPAVWVLGRPTGFSGDVVQVNDLLVGQLAAEHLISRGHRRLAFISPKPSQVALMRRQAAFAFFAQQAGATVKAFLGKDQTWTFPSSAVENVDAVQGLVDKMLAERKRPSAIFAPDDSVGAMVARALAARGLQIGREVSLMSCNNEHALLLGIFPALTTIDVQANQIGCRAVDQLAWRIAHREQSLIELNVEPTLVEGSSVATV
jgi:DNA-binding LacI/PurR family transcriptional regulator